MAGRQVSGWEAVDCLVEEARVQGLQADMVVVAATFHPIDHRPFRFGFKFDM